MLTIATSLVPSLNIVPGGRPAVVSRAGAGSTDGYEHNDSKSIAGGKFVGLACDEDNQPDMSEDRVKAWVGQIKGEGMPL